MLVRRVKIRNYTTGFEQVKDLSVDQHERLMRLKCERTLPVDIEVLLERDLPS